MFSPPVAGAFYITGGRGATIIIKFFLDIPALRTLENAFSGGERNRFEHP
jgi:hypothetical protein